MSFRASYGEVTYKWRAVVGTVDYRRGDTYRFSTYIVHERFSMSSMSSDIALLKTTRPIQMKQRNGYYTVNGICLPDSQEDSSGQLTVSGWGALYYDGMQPTHLQEVKVIPHCSMASIKSDLNSCQ